jgi:Type III secretion protein (HpaP)
LSRLVGELGESLQVSEQTRAGHWSIRLQLKQEILPSTELLMASDGYCISARFRTTDAQVERLLNAERDELARALSGRNRLRIQIEVERVGRLP